VGREQRADDGRKGGDDVVTREARVAAHAALVDPGGARIVTVDARDVLDALDVLDV
jgi:hypothetical protein